MAGDSSSFTVTVAVPGVQFATLAVKTTFCGPSASRLSAASKVKFTGPVLPEGITTLAGTKSRVEGALSCTVTFSVGAVLTLTLPLSPVEPSAALAGAVSVKIADSSSVTARLCVPVPMKGAEAVITAVCVPSRFASSTSVIVKVFEVSPARSVRLAGTVAADVLLEDRFTVTFVSCATLRFRVAVIGESDSAAVEAAAMLNWAVDSPRNSTSSMFHPE